MIILIFQIILILQDHNFTINKHLLPIINNNYH
jgi:hypothetical protein